MSTGVLKTCRELEKKYIYKKKGIVRQVGYLQEENTGMFLSSKVTNLSD
jgi:hypothetical protein